MKKILGAHAEQEGLCEAENMMERLLRSLTCGLDEKEVEVVTGIRRIVFVLAGVLFDSAGRDYLRC